jgi:type IV secretion system protein VirD4
MCAKRVDNGQILRGMWTVGTTLHDMAANAAREEQARQAALEHDRQKNALLAENSPLAGMAEPGDLQQYKFKPESIYLGLLHEDHGVDIGPAGITDPRGVFVMAGSRSGKGRSILIQNAIRWPGPLLMIDPKGEAASITAMRRGSPEAARGSGTSVRKFLGQDVAILDPFGETIGPARKHKIGYNPLIDIDMNRSGGVNDILALANSLITPEQGNGAHFSETAETVVAGLLEKMMLRDKPADRTLPNLRRHLLLPFDELQEELSGVDTRAGLAREAWSMMDNVGVDEWGSHKSTLSRNLKWLASPEMQDHLGASSFSLYQAVQQGWSVFIVLPPTKMATYKAWMRVLVRTALNAKEAMGTNQTGPQTLFMLDEFPLLGHFSLIENAAGYLAGYGIKLMPVIQNLTQLTDHYPKNWETIVGNQAATIGFGFNDKTGEEHLSAMLGKVMVWEESFGFSSGTSSQDGFTAAGGANAGMSSNLSRRERQVRFPNEIHEQAAPDTMRAFVVPATGKPFMIRRKNYDSIKHPGLFDSPQFITEWERRFGARVKQ